MSNRIDLSGMDEFQDLIKDMEITDEKGKAAMRKAIKPAAKEVISNSPERTKKLKNSVVQSVKKENLCIVGSVKLGMFYGGLEEFGTSKSKKHVGFFSRSINKTKDEVVKILADELLK